VRDEVDRLMAEWERERPDLDVGPLHVLSRITRLAHHLELARRAAFAVQGLAAWEFDVLAALRRSGPPYQANPVELMRRTLVTSGTMTARLDGLSSSGYLRRRPDPNDRRGVLVRLTRKGRAAVDACLADLLSRERELLAPLTLEQQRRLGNDLRRLLVGFEG
jgi:DNA-binding MarR family transcriptional regulator